MSVWFTSDLHIHHRFVAGARMLGSYDIDRDLITPEMVEAHDQMLAESIDDVVKKDDVVWFLGDLTGGGNVEAGLDFIRARPGAWHMITGNHDKPHPLHSDSHKWQRKFLEAFESVQMAARRSVVVDGVKHNVMLSHFPYTEDHSPESRHMEWRLRDEGDFLIHGHTHSREKFSGKQIHVGVDAHDFAPVHLDYIVEAIRQY